MREVEKTFTAQIRGGFVVVQDGVIKFKTLYRSPKASPAQEKLGIKPTMPAPPKQAAYFDGIRFEERGPLNMARKHATTEICSRMVAAGFTKHGNS